MIKSFWNKLMMYKAVLDYLKSVSDRWSQVADLVADVGAMEALVDEIDQTNRHASGDIRGKTDQKDVEQKKVIGMANRIAFSLAAMAARTGNNDLLMKTDFPVSHLEKQRDLEQANTADEMASLAREHLEALASANITEADVVALEEQTQRYRACLPANRVSVAERKAANKKLKGLFVKADQLLKKQIDKLALGVASTDPEFYEGYKNARIIVDYGTRHEQTAGQSA